MFQKSRQNRLSRDAEKALERNLLHVEYHDPLPWLDFTLIEVLDNLFNSNKTAFQGFGSVSAGSV
jgi:hypothetical protein